MYLLKSLSFTAILLLGHGSGGGGAAAPPRVIVNRPCQRTRGGMQPGKGGGRGEILYTHVLLQ
jgi:hypothetical protein